MKDTEIHNGLKNKEIRDFLATNIVNAYNKERENNLKIPSISNLNGLDWAIERAKMVIKNKQNELERLEIYKAVTLLAKKYGWSEYDVSDYVVKSDGNKLHWNFFGTQKEYNLFLQTNNFGD